METDMIHFSYFASKSLNMMTGHHSYITHRQEF
jgi:hypothetical protein